jgi:hypothetical protein
MTTNQTGQRVIGRDTEIDAGGVRLSPSTYEPPATPSGPSAVKPCGMVHIARGKKAFVVPRELSVSEIRSVVSDFAASARRARAAGADADYPTFVVAPTVINVTVAGRNRFIVRAVSWFEVQKRRKDTL